MPPPMLERRRSAVPSTAEPVKTSSSVSALIALAAVLRRVRGPLARGLLAVSSAAVIVAMTLAALYAVGNPLGISALGLEDMVRWHGSFNGLGYVFCGLLGWNLRQA